jgi:hypothetical protein
MADKVDSRHIWQAIITSHVLDEYGTMFDYRHSIVIDLNIKIPSQIVCQCGCTQSLETILRVCTQVRLPWTVYLHLRSFLAQNYKKLLKSKAVLFDK